MKLEINYDEMGNRLVKIAEIQVPFRYRRDMGNIEELARSIEKWGLLHPILITPDGVLVCGERRLRACRDYLHWSEIPVQIIELQSFLEAQIDENRCRKDYTISERRAIVDALRGYTHGGDRRSASARGQEDEKLTLEEAARRVGLGGKDGYYRARVVEEKGIPQLREKVDRDDILLTVAAEIAKMDPQHQQELLEQGLPQSMRDVKSFRRQRKSKQQVAAQDNGNPATRNWQVVEAPDVVPCDLLFFTYPAADFEGIARETILAWSTCGACFIVIVGPSELLWDARARLDTVLDGYHYHQMAVWHSPKWSRFRDQSRLRASWQAILIYRRNGTEPQIRDEGWMADLTDHDCVPAPKDDLGVMPLAVFRWLINALSKQDQTVVSLCPGSTANCGVAAVQLGRRFHGVEPDKREQRRAEGRLGAFGGVPCPKLPIRPLPLNTVIHGNCMDLISSLEDDLVALALLSPPYGEQRAGLYAGVADTLFPELMLRWMSALWDKLKSDGSVCVVIRPDHKNGQPKDYVLRTRLALRAFGWNECEELIWYKPDGGAGMGSNTRPRRVYESILWFSKSPDPYVDLKACGTSSTGKFQPWHDPTQKSRGQLRPSPVVYPEGQIARISDVIHIPTALTPRGVDHPAMYPVELAEYLIRSFCRPGGLVLDPFAGSGNTLIAAKRLGHPFIGFDIAEKYCEMARQRLEKLAIPQSSVG